MQAVTKCYQSGWRLVKKRRHMARYWKRTAHERVRRATREWLHRGRWDAEAIEARPVTSWDVA